MNVANVAIELGTVRNDEMKTAVLSAWMTIEIWHGPWALTGDPGVQEDLESDVDTLTEDELEPMYKVLIHNDEVTPMDFVVIILQRIFGLTSLESEHVMFTAHYNGLAYVTTLPLNEAQKRVSKAHFAAQLEGYPLTFSIEPE
jgi:ATP-dependent Clp protease adaptor protein ClpS